MPTNDASSLQDLSERLAGCGSFLTVIAQVYSETSRPKPNSSPKRSVFDPAYLLLVHEPGKPKLERLEQRLSCSKRADSGRTGGSHNGKR